MDFLYYLFNLILQFIKTIYIINYYDCTHNIKFCLDGYNKKGSNIYVATFYCFIINLVGRNK